MNPDPTIAYLFGTTGTATESYHADGTDTSSSISRTAFRHHTFQRIKKTGESGNPAVKIQVCFEVDDTDEASWSTLGTLNNTTPLLQITNQMLPKVRAVRDDGVADKIKVLVCSCNTRAEM